ncbi:MAG: hypothetical protein Q9221_004273 [Calogaya cf. arnoldii]
MGGFLAPDPTNGFTNCMHAFGFIRPTRNETERRRKSKLRFRRQNPGSKPQDVVPSRPLLPPHSTDLDTACALPIQTYPSRHTSPLTRPSRERRKLCKKRAVKKASVSTALSIGSAPLDDHLPTPPPLPPRPEIKIETEQQIVSDGTNIVAKSPVIATPPVTATSPVTASLPVTAGPPATALDVNPFDDQQNTSKEVNTNDNNAELLDALPSLRPRLPHQRMHYLRRLGDGGEGHIDLFRLHCAPQTLLAVKTLRRTPDLICHKNNTRKPLEAHLLQDLLPTPHPHIVQMFGYTCTPRKTIFFYEYCSLGDLQDVVENYFSHRVKIPEGFIWHVFGAIAKALAYLHTGYIAPSPTQNADSSANADADSLALLQMYSEPWTPILHRDIKPENIFFRPSSSSSPYPVPLLADFGLATHQTPDPYQCSGTFTYQGPEIPTQTAASDLWSLGATIHALIHGRPPMHPQPMGRSTESWEFDPRSRRVLGIEERGYSSQLEIVMRGVLRRRMEERVKGKRLVGLVELGRKEWGGEEVGMEEWAFGGVGEVEEGRIKGFGEKPWKRG